MSPQRTILLILLLLGVAIVECIFGWNAKNIPLELARQVLLLSWCFWVVCIVFFFNNWNKNQGSFLLLGGGLLSIFFGGSCLLGLDVSDFASSVLQVNAMGSVALFCIFLYIFSPGIRGEHDSVES